MTTRVASAVHLRCARCGKPTGCKTGFGSRCRAMVEQAILLSSELRDPATGRPAFSDDQRDKAIQLIRDGGFSRAELSIGLATPDTTFYAVASHGLGGYLVTVDACNCPATKPCYHRLVVVALLATVQQPN